MSTKTNTLPSLRKIAKAAGAEIAIDRVIDDMAVTISLDAPEGFHFTATGTHIVCSGFILRGDAAARRDAIKSLADDLNGGFSPCPLGADCEEGGH